MKPKAFLAIFVSLIFIFRKAHVAAAGGLVIAHYLLYAEDGADVLKQEIQLAQSKGIDAFALNTELWDAQRAQRADAIFKAAQDLGSGFKLFFSADMNHDTGTLTPDNIVAMLTYSSSSLLKYNGKQMFQAWLGDDDAWWQQHNYANSKAGWQDIFQKAGGKDKFFFVPFFPTDGSYYGVRGRLETFGDVIDGLHAWDVSAWPYFSSGFQSPDFSRDENYLQACNEKSKAYMPSVSPWWFKKNVAAECVRGNYQGPGLWMAKWNEVITKLNTPFLQIVTWNDWVESHYVGPTTLSKGATAASVNYVKGFPHLAFLELGEHYIRWYKTGIEPAVTEDSLYMFYYTQSKNLGAECSGSANLTDKLYVTAMVTQPPATLELSSGGASQTFTITAKGISTLSMDFQQGQQAAVLKRGNAVVSTLKGNQPITNVYSNFNVYSTCTKCSIE